MATLASITGKTDYTSPAISIPGTGTVQLFVHGALGPRGRVLLQIKGADAVFHAYPELTFNRAAAVELQLQAADLVCVQFINCESANAEVRQ